jgi:acetyl-CoA carboxylase carboxyltransferase component
MFDEVLKFGSMIVDALVAYQQPLFVYIPPFAELRGGAWVVVDSTINSDVMEFYAAEDARGGVLEAAGAASIKFRDRDIVASAHRLDHALKELDAQLRAKTGTAVEADIRKKIATRERLLQGVYQQVRHNDIYQCVVAVVVFSLYKIATVSFWGITVQLLD